MGGNHGAPTMDAAGEQLVRAEIEELPDLTLVERSEADSDVL